MHDRMTLTRRAFFAGDVAPRHHVSSAVVMTLPERRGAISRRLSTMAGVEVHAEEGSRIVVTIEGPTSGMLGETLIRISAMDGVISANMVYEHVDEGRKADI